MSQCPVCQSETHTVDDRAGFNASGYSWQKCHNCGWSEIGGCGIHVANIKANILASHPTQNFLLHTPGPYTTYPFPFDETTDVFIGGFTHAAIKLRCIKSQKVCWVPVAHINIE